MDCRVAALLAMTAIGPREAALPRHREATLPSSRGRQAVAIHDFVPAWIAASLRSSQ